MLWLSALEDSTQLADIDAGSHKDGAGEVAACLLRGPAEYNVWPTKDVTPPSSRVSGAAFLGRGQAGSLKAGQWGGTDSNSAERRRHAVPAKC